MQAATVHDLRAVLLLASREDPQLNAAANAKWKLPLLRKVERFAFGAAMGCGEGSAFEPLPRPVIAKMFVPVGMGLNLPRSAAPATAVDREDDEQHGRAFCRASTLRHWLSGIGLGHRSRRAFKREFGLPPFRDSSRLRRLFSSGASPVQLHSGRALPVPARSGRANFKRA